MNVAPNSPDWSEPNNAAALRWLLKTWEPRHADAARKEGWSIWDCNGSENAPWQICKFDCPDEADSGELAEDCDAWRLVCEGTGEHHQLAREFLTLFVPNTELVFVAKWYAKQEK